MNIHLSFTQFRKRTLTFSLKSLVLYITLLLNSITLRLPSEKTTNLHFMVLSKVGIKSICKNHSKTWGFFLASLDNFTKYVCISENYLILLIFCLHRNKIMLYMLLSNFFLCAQDDVPGICP